ncbi:3647_t:CDS:2, partial [Diversispora eburnea]
MCKNHRLLNIKEDESEKLLKLNKINNFGTTQIKKTGQNLNVPDDPVPEKQFSETGNSAVADLPKHVSHVDLLS